MDNELMLVVINEGVSYKRRCDAVTLPPEAQAAEFSRIVVEQARRYYRQFGEGFTAIEILKATVAVAEYMAQHIAENKTAG